VGRDLDPDEWIRKANARVELDRFFLAEIEKRQDQPDDDLLGALVEATGDADAAYRLSVAEVISVAEQLLVGGNETTTQLLGEILRLLAEHPDQLQRLRDDPSLVPNAVEEALRLGSPVVGVYKQCVVDSDVGGTVIPAGWLVAVMWGSANRDATRFDAPDEFGVDRTDAKEHIAKTTSSTVIVRAQEAFQGRDRRRLFSPVRT
jgi:cytochrome P450